MPIKHYPFQITFDDCILQIDIDFQGKANVTHEWIFRKWVRPRKYRQIMQL